MFAAGVILSVRWSVRLCARRVVHCGSTYTDTASRSVPRCQSGMLHSQSIIQESTRQLGKMSDRSSKCQSLSTDSNHNRFQFWVVIDSISTPKYWASLLSVGYDQDRFQFLVVIDSLYLRNTGCGRVLVYIGLQMTDKIIIDRLQPSM